MQTDQQLGDVEAEAAAIARTRFLTIDVFFWRKKFSFSKLVFPLISSHFRPRLAQFQNLDMASQDLSSTVAQDNNGIDVDF